MARPKKTGLNYFPQDVEITKDERIVMANCGLSGIAIYNAVVREILKQGYYAEINGEFKSKVCERTWLQWEDIEEVLKKLAINGVFSEELYIKGILTGKEIQNMVFDVYADGSATTYGDVYEKN
jgi:hypothetical protein